MPPLPVPLNWLWPPPAGGPGGMLVHDRLGGHDRDSRRGREGPHFSPPALHPHPCPSVPAGHIVAADQAAQDLMGYVSAIKFLAIPNCTFAAREETPAPGTGLGVSPCVRRRLTPPRPIRQELRLFFSY